MKKIISMILALVVGVILWYLLLKPSDYIIRFKAHTFPGAINQSLKHWSRNLTNSEKISQEEDLFHLSQEIKFGDSTNIYNWEIESITDSTSHVKVKIRDKEHSLMNKILVPFYDTDFEKRSRATVLDFMQELKKHKESFKVRIVGEEEISTKYIAYLPIKTTQLQKADEMMRNFSYLMGTLIESGVEFDGFPIIEITKWNRDTDSIYFNFGRPIIRSEKLPIGTDIQYKRIFRKKALKAEYNGNYITSDRAWYALLDYAQKNNIEVENTPYEIFHDNPQNEGNQIKWKAEIFLPLKEPYD
ncbi:AraC family transcriptional regulator [Muricauda oceani]|uniref:AraC family transcriptional regulator n=1 Tax=Flagellimonas oceani TaxID=2698672 RepID=A0A6G7J6B9_9FLAO|nr:AraC family transcriptional regulator [Allomuricauda oceani]MBW8242204.1 AraC family transcriptional regulator [Allomuricauda oceani]QII45967.1 AraC family transcriptional regulator [Allomuricauda oceani]